MSPQKSIDESVFHSELSTLIKKIADYLLTKNLLLATAESCTGGWVSKCCTDLPGSSAWFDCGFVTYSNHAKHHQLGVSKDTLKKHGAVSQAVVEEMANGAIKNSQANISLAITGIAGPDGGSITKPVGTVWIAWADENSLIKSQCYTFNGDRDIVRKQAVISALSGILENARA